MVCAVQREQAVGREAFNEEFCELKAPWRSNCGVTRLVNEASMIELVSKRDGGVRQPAATWSSK